MSVADIIRDIQPLEAAGGETWYDALDNRLRDPAIFAALAKLVDANFPGALIVTSGRFGHEFDRWVRYAQPRRRVIVLPGGLRHSPECHIDFWRLQGCRNYVFVDDTLFAGRTKAAVESALKRAGRWLDGTVVAFESPQAPVDETTFALYSRRKVLAESEQFKRLYMGEFLAERP